MGLFKSLKGKHPDNIGGENSGRYDQYQDSSEKRRIFGQSGTEEEGYQQPPKQLAKQAETTYQPPPGPPPDYGNFGSLTNPPPYHDWQSIEDTANLPPPPTVRYESSINNASEEDSARAQAWCDQNPLYTPSKPHIGIYRAIQSGDVNLVKPPELHGDLVKTGLGQFRGKTKGSRDALLLTGLPLYFAAADSPLQTEVGKTIYFEVRLVRLGWRSNESGLAIGFCSRPYPTWRLCGWERAGLGVHGDDGRRFINDSFGGHDFTEPFAEGDTVGIGMTFTSGTPAFVDVEVFFTRNGRREGAWNLFEQRDEACGDVEGLEGRWDLYGAIGIFGDVEFISEFSPSGWRYQPG